MRQVNEAPIYDFDTTKSLSRAEETLATLNGNYRRGPGCRWDFFVGIATDFSVNPAVSDPLLQGRALNLCMR